MSKEKHITGLWDFRPRMDEEFSAEMERVLSNIADERTNWRAQREIHITVKLRPISHTREIVGTSYTIVSKLSPVATVVEEMAILPHSDGYSLLSMAKGTQMELSEIMAMDEKVKKEGGL